MTDTGNSPANSTHPHSGDSYGCRRRRGPRVALLALFAVSAGFFAGKALSQGAGPVGNPFGDRPGITRIFAPATVDDATDRATRFARHLAAEVDATYDQEQKLVVLAKGVASDVYGMRRQMIDARKKGLELLKAPTVDRTAVEALRTEQMARLDGISKRLSTAVADASEILNAEQRAKLVERIETWRERFGWMKRWHRD